MTIARAGALALREPGGGGTKAGRGRHGVAPHHVPESNPLLTVLKLGPRGRRVGLGIDTVSNTPGRCTTPPYSLSAAPLHARTDKVIYPVTVRYVAHREG